MRFVAITFLFIVTAFAAVPAFASLEDNGKQFVDTMAGKVLAIIQDKTKSDDAKEAELRTIFNDKVDIDWMGRFAAGRYFARMSDEEKKRYSSAYHDYLLNSYVPRFREYTGEKIQVNGASKAAENEVMVQTSIVVPNVQQPVLVDYRLKSAQGGFRVVDIIAEGISLITTQRTDFGTAIGNEGVDAFLARLEAKAKSSAAQ